jgi:hypothetical protein
MPRASLKASAAATIINEKNRARYARPGYSGLLSAPLGAARRTLRPTHHCKHYAYDDDDDRHPYQKMSSAHGRRSDAAKPEQSRDQRDDNENERVVDQISGHDRMSPMSVRCKAVCRLGGVTGMQAIRFHVGATN